MAEQERRPPLTLPWWAVAVGLAAALKLHFSAAAASELAWMLRPLTVILRTTAGWHFLLNAAGEWECPDAGIVLVKACAGINFMVLSFLGWSWALRPAAAGHAPGWGRFMQRMGLALLAAWATTLLVNATRILAIVHWQPALEHWLPPADAHRLLGLFAYLPALTLQWWLVDRAHPARALLLAAGLYAALMLAVPIVTGHALLNTGGYLRHAGFVLALLLPILLLAAALVLCARAARPAASADTGAPVLAAGWGRTSSRR